MQCNQSLTSKSQILNWFEKTELTVLKAEILTDSVPSKALKAFWLGSKIQAKKIKIKSHVFKIVLDLIFFPLTIVFLDCKMIPQHLKLLIKILQNCFAMKF